MNKLSQVAEAEERARQTRVLWIDKNRGVLTQIANELGVTQVFVGDVFHRRRNSSDGEVEKRLTEVGAPGFESPQQN
jgi:hypothetical protein